MQNIQLKTEEYQLSNSIENIFKLTPLPIKSNLPLNLEYNFASLYCPKTEKIIRTLPSICDQKSSTTLFRSEIDNSLISKISTLKGKKTYAQSPQSMKHIGQVQKIIYVPKPSSIYCQICKQSFNDYLQHINHPLHEKKIKQCSAIYKDIDDLTDILKRKTINIAKNKQKNEPSASSTSQKQRMNKITQKSQAFSGQKIQKKTKKVTYQNEIQNMNDYLDYQKKQGARKELYKMIKDQRKLQQYSLQRMQHQYKMMIKKTNVYKILLHQRALIQIIVRMNKFLILKKYKNFES